jgi:uridine kinase
MDKRALESTVESIVERRKNGDRRQSLVVGVSGIDASGKGYITQQIIERLLACRLRTVPLHGDEWLNLPHQRFSRVRPAHHFYEHALRLDDMFQELVLPLKRQRSHRGIMHVVEETATAYREEEFAFEDVDIILVECIFLFKRRVRPHIDLALWIDCSFETALKRAIRRGQEGLSEAETIRAYETIYFPAQRVHFRKDRPRETADFILFND